MGLRTLALPEDLGGVGADALTSCIVTEELAVGDTDVAAVLAETSALGLRLFGGDDAGAARALRRGVPGGRRLSPGAGLPRARRRQRARHQLPPPRRRRCASPPPRPATATIGSSTAPRTASPTRPIAKLIAVEAQTDKGAALFLVPRETPGLTVTEQPEPRWYHGSCGQLSLKDVRVPAGNLLGISGASDAGRAAPARPGAQPRHRPRRLRGRAGIRGASRPGRPPHRRASGDRHQTRRDRHPPRYRPHRHLAGGLGLRPSRRLCRPQPARPAAHHHRQGVHRRDDLSRREGRRRMLRRHGRDARHAAAEIHPRRADLPAHRRRQRRRQAAHRRGAGRTTAAAQPMLAAE